MSSVSSRKPARSAGAPCRTATTAAVTSAGFELAYVLLLSAAYVRAPLSVFYPIARGLAPVIVLIVAAVALGAATSWEQVFGVCAVGAGILLVRGRKPDRAATVFGLTIAATIAGYTLVDNTASPSPIRSRTSRR